MVEKFSGEFGFLSNFYEQSIWVNGHRYPSVEHAYQAAKSNNVDTQKLIREAKTPGIAKRLGKAVQLVAGWDNKREQVMYELLQKKFEDPILKAMLLATEDAILIEGNTWNDTTWGICKGKGQNLLGILLMQVREKCRHEQEIET